MQLFCRPSVIQVFQVLRETAEGLVRALEGSIFLAHRIAFSGRGEDHPHDKLGFAAMSLKGDRRLQRYRLNVFASAMAVDQTLRPHDLIVGDPVLVIAAIGSVHDEPSFAARPDVN